MNILLTSDDGYNAIGIRTLISLLHSDHTLTVVGTRTQQSGVGGKITLRGSTYTETMLDDIQAFVLDGTPVDCMEFAHAKFSRPFDLVISGINMGENVSTAIISSGTVSAAHRALGLGIAPKALALSWVTPPDYYLRAHDENEDITQYLETPGKMVGNMLFHLFNNKFYESAFLNVNFPNTHTNEFLWSYLAGDIRSCYPPIHIDEEINTYAYPLIQGDNNEKDVHADISVLRSGTISVTPLDQNWTNRKLYDRYSQNQTQKTAIS